LSPHPGPFQCLGALIPEALWIIERLLVKFVVFLDVSGFDYIWRGIINIAF
jgi:hypothetical protein